MSPRSTESIDLCTTVRVGYFGAMCRVAEFHSAVGGEMHLLRLGRSCYLNEHGMAWHRVFDDAGSPRRRRRARGEEGGRGRGRAAPTLHSRNSVEEGERLMMEKERRRRSGQMSNEWSKEE